ncbi:hypothetical protein ALC56_08048, partial [Trachymyrmex septentrionalis]
RTEVRTVPTAKNRWKSRRSSKSELCPGPWQYNGLNVASRLPRKQPYSINGVESYLMGRSARASDSSARQPPCNLLVSSPHGTHHAATSSVSHHSVVAGVSHVMSSSQSLQHCSYTRSSAQQGMQQQQQPQCGAYLPLQGRAW